MRIVSWNINRGYKKEGILKFLKKTKSDIYLLTEIDRWNGRTGNADVFSYLQKGLKIKGKFAKEFEEHNSIWRKIIPTGGPGGGIHGNAIFSKYSIEDYKVINLPFSKKLKWEGKTIIPELFEPRKGNRIAQIIKIKTGNRTCVLVNTHLENWRGSWEHRKKQLECILNAVKGEKHTIIAGDLNPVQGVWKAVITRSVVHKEIIKLRQFFKQNNFYDPFKDSDHTQRLSAAKLDWIAMKSSIKVKSKKNIRTRLSDHNCLIVDVE